MAPPNHLHVSERQPGADTDCLWMSGVEFLREAYDLSIPATHEEGDALRAASGDTGFSNIRDFRRGVARRYPSIRLPQSVVGRAAFWSAFKPGSVAIVSGRLTNMSAHYRRFYPNFTGGHAVYTAKVGPGRDDNWWCDPGGPHTKYVGEPITKDMLNAFIGAYGFSQLVHLSLAAQPPQEENMPDLTTYIPGYTATIKRDAAIRSAPSLTATKLRGTSAQEKWSVTGWTRGEVYNGSDQWLVWWNAGRWEYTVKANVIAGPTAPISVGYTQEQVDALVEATKAADAAACEASTALAIEAERERISAVLGL